MCQRIWIDVSITIIISVDFGDHGTGALINGWFDTYIYL